MSPEEYKERHEKELKKVRNIKDGLINKVVEDFTDYAIHTLLFF